MMQTMKFLIWLQTWELIHNFKYHNLETHLAAYNDDPEPNPWDKDVDEFIRRKWNRLVKANGR